MAGYSHLTRLSKNDSQVIDETTSHLTKAASCQVIGYGYSHSAMPPKNGNQVAGYAALRKKFLANISNICGAAKFFPRLAFGRTLNF